MRIYIKTLLVVLAMCIGMKLQAQTNMRAPKQGGVYQRGSDDKAAVPISGQLFGNQANYTVTCTATRLDGNNNPISGITPIQTTINAPKGIFNGSITLPKGWYRFTFTNSGGFAALEIYAGVGDVFVIAGQSNAQGKTGSGFTTPAAQGNPEFIRGSLFIQNCDRRFGDFGWSIYPLAGWNSVGPTGSTRWAYEALGKKISDANGGMPVLFFNTAAGGSSVKNWSDGANGLTALHPNFSTPWCQGYPVGEDQTPQPDDFYKGQPYLTLRNVLNWYVQQFGVRAVLWHQGEADAASNTSQNSPTASAYAGYLNNVIAKSRTDLGNSNLSWIVAQASLSADNLTGGTTAPNAAAIGVTTGQSNTWGTQNPPTNKVFKGPLTDKYAGASTQNLRPDDTHFSEANSNGVTKLATLWNGFLDASSAAITPLTRIPAAAVPNVSVVNNNSVYTITAASGYDGYCWIKGYPDDYYNAPPLNTTSCFGTSQSLVTSGSGYYRCYVRKGLNWQFTTAVVPQGICSNCREGIEENNIASEENLEDKVDVGFVVSPNPSHDGMKIDFNVARESDVRLEIFDASGNSVRVLANGSHAKGHYQYPVQRALPKAGTYICQLMIGEMFFTRKIVQAE